MSLHLSRRRFLGAVAGSAAVASSAAAAGCLGSSDPSDADRGDGNRGDAGGSDADRTLTVTTARQYSSPGCSCCHRYAEYLRPHLDASLSEHSPSDVAAVKRRHGVPGELQSCHTLVLDEYVVEGHVPAGVVATLLDERPAVDGIALPGMPAGSPGMGGAKDGAFRVYAFAGGEPDGVYGTH